MNIDRLKILQILTSQRRSILYLVTDGHGSYVLKTPREGTDAVREAYVDEYETMKNISHPMIPKYYDYDSAVLFPDSTEPKPALLMEYITGIPLSAQKYLTTKQIKKYILDLGDALMHLLFEGVLYTDLHPGNLMIQDGQLKLIDFTQAYYFLRNPYPAYTPKISYQLDQNLKGQQMLIQALTFLLIALEEQFFIKKIPPSLVQLGKHPKNGFSFTDFLQKLDREWEV